MMLKGAMHAHSTYSDGEFTLEELRRIYLEQSCSFLCITDHSEYFDAQIVQTYMNELQRLSDREFCFVMGLEYRCEREMHILGYGASVLSTSTDPQTIIRHIGSQGAIAVIAHPKNDFFSWIESFEALPRGIEVWNSKYDGRYAPRPGTFALLQRLRERVPGMHAFYGQDLHWKKQFRGLCVEVECDALNPAVILTALAAGKYSGKYFGKHNAGEDELHLPSSGILTETQLLAFEQAQARSRRMRQFLKGGKQTLDRLGIRLPASVKAQLRRIF
jgi:hypothetical protein